MILIVEGSNKVGKTTFINTLANILEADGIRVEIQNKRPAKNNEYEVTKEKMADITKDDFINALRKSLANVNYNHVYIFDRSYISEYVYGKKYRGYERESGDDAWKLRKISDAEDKLYPIDVSFCFYVLYCTLVDISIYGYDRSNVLS